MKKLINTPDLLLAESLAGFAVDADTKLHFVIAEIERRLSSGRHRA